MIYKRLFLALSPAIILGSGHATSKWNPLWDHRKETIKSKHHLFLIRHGQYGMSSIILLIIVSNDPKLTDICINEDQEFLLNDPLRPLTELGRNQALLTGKRLVEILKYEGFFNDEGSAIKLTSSNSTRAKETATIILKELSSALSELYKKKIVLELTIDPILREGPPCQPSGYDGSWAPGEASFWDQGIRIEGAFRKYFHRPDIITESPDYMKKGNTMEQVHILVGHGNVWRFCALRGLQLSAERWLNFGKANASITRMSSSSSGWVGLTGFGDTGHFPPSMITHN